MNMGPVFIPNHPGQRKTIKTDKKVNIYEPLHKGMRKKGIKIRAKSRGYSNFPSHSFSCAHFKNTNLGRPAEPGNRQKGNCQNTFFTYNEDLIFYLF